MANKFNFDLVIKRMKDLDISLYLANTAKTDFMNNFKEQGFDGAKWKEVKRRISGTPAYEYPKKKGISRRTKPILTNTGRLRRDVSNSVKNGAKNSNLSYTLIVNNPYAGYLNEGTNRVPQRRFVGLTKKLNDALLQKIMQKTNKIWEN